MNNRNKFYSITSSIKELNDLDWELVIEAKSNNEDEIKKQALEEFQEFNRTYLYGEALDSYNNFALDYVIKG